MYKIIIKIIPNCLNEKYSLKLCCKKYDFKNIQNDFLKKRRIYFFYL